MARPADYQQRQQALDIAHSWIVQAPAGSGKTATLVYRLLALLAVVDQPEQVLAITFTRKAAKEMRDRVLHWLERAQNTPDDAAMDSFELQGLQLARAVLKRDHDLDWQLLSMPHRLNVETIDALCARLVGEMPWLSRLGERPATTEAHDELFSAAIDQLLAELLDEQSGIDSPLAQLLYSQDGNYRRMRQMLKAMLHKRDQWLRYLVGDIDELRAGIEAGWQSVSDGLLKELNASVPVGMRTEMAELAAFAATQLAPEKAKDLAAFTDNPDFPAASFDAIEQWLGIRQLLLTNSQLRRERGITKTVGFPAGTPENQRMKALVQALEGEPDFIDKLADLPSIPPPKLTDEQWQQLEVLSSVLVRLVQHLQVHFHQAGACDFSEVATRALLALSELGEPTELALRLDYQIHHILVDEFQDTSFVQFSLLQNLTRGWQQDDGRTLFLVGDPMQSIYRFREADVGLFLRISAQSQALPVAVQPLVLSENFRSSSTLVDWFNQAFSATFPSYNDETAGAIVYRSATSSAGSGPVPECVAAGDRQQHAQQVVTLVQQALQRGDKSIAILVRSRTSLIDIVPALEQANIAFSGVDIKPLDQAQDVQDAIALCRALVRPDDRIAWLSLLRGPWCGLSLAEITQLVGNGEMPVWQQLTSLTLEPITETNQRLQRFIQVIQEALEQRQRVSLRELVQWTWQRLGGESALFELATDDLQRVWQLIEALDDGGDIGQLERLQDGLSGLYAQPQDGEAIRVVVSTIHNAKGLQYETVILADLARRGRADDKEILRWANVVDGDQDWLLLAPLMDEQMTNSHYGYLNHLHKQREYYEQMRLLYVACTRAEQRLYLLAELQTDKNDEIKTPVSGSLLAHVWPVLKEYFVLPADAPQTKDQEQHLPQTLRRLTAAYQWNDDDNIAWQPDSSSAIAVVEPKEAGLEYEWATLMAQAVGITLHDWLQYHGSDIVNQGAFNEQTEEQRDKQWEARWRADFLSLNVEPQYLDNAIKRMRRAVGNLMQDQRARWIFDPSHQHARNEYTLSAWEEGQLKTWRIDRTFVDADNVRWIIDYKSTVHWDDDVDTFIDSQIEERHRPQLENYGRLFDQIENRKICLGVYFPLLQQWRAWEYLAD